MKKTLREKLKLHIEKLKQEALSITETIETLVSDEEYSLASRWKTKRDTIYLEIDALTKIL